MLVEEGAAREAEKQRLRDLITVQYDGQKMQSCFWCIGIALTLPSRDPNLAELCRVFSGPSALTHTVLPVQASRPPGSKAAATVSYMPQDQIQELLAPSKPRAYGPRHHDHAGLEGQGMRHPDT